MYIMYMHICIYYFMYKSKGKWPLLSVLVTFLIATTEYVTEGNLGEEGVILAYIWRGHAVYPGREGMATV